VDDPLQTAARAVAGARRVVVFTGAGASKESGIPTFRETETGLWARYDPMELATEQAFRERPAFVWTWYEHRFGIAAAALPNPGHLAIAELETLVPQVVVITQNVDGLHQRAGSGRVIELHGSMHTFRCMSGAHRGYTLADVGAQAEKPPRCPACGDLLRPEVVWFGESLPAGAMEEAEGVGRACDVMLVVGTSGVVYPAALLPFVARRAGAFVIDVDPRRGEMALAADLYLQGSGGEVLPALVAAVRARREC
jgi:NAD-dependent deacetylase